MFVSREFSVIHKIKRFSDLEHFLSEHKAEYDNLSYFIANGEDWNLQLQEPARKSLISAYFAFTTLTTVGFGDYYPINNIERLAGAFVLLFGVACFSFIMGELLLMIRTVKNLTDDVEDDSDLE